MSLYVLDDQLRRETMIDQYESLIWTERFAAFGDFELIIQATSKFREILAEGKQLSYSDSTRVMEIETITDTTDEDGLATLTITGPSIEILLDRRVAMPAVFPTIPAGSPEGTPEPKWTITGLPADIARHVFELICYQGTIDKNDIIPFLTPGNIYPADTLPEPLDAVMVELEVATVYQIVKDICDAYDLGFRLVRGGDDSKLYFNIYAGSDRTSAQSAVPSVVFSRSLDNLAKVTELTSSSTYKNVAYVMWNKTRTVVYSTDVDPNVKGFARRVLLVNVTSMPEFTGSAQEIAIQQKAYLEKAGATELAKNRKVAAFDGEITQFGQYQYNKHYQLGDMVEMRAASGASKNMRVSEQIFVSDKEGKRTYPTLTDILFITPGSWVAWDYSMNWEDATQTWETA